MLICFCQPYFSIYLPNLLRVTGNRTSFGNIVFVIVTWCARSENHEIPACARFEDFTAILLKIQFFRDVTGCPTGLLDPENECTGIFRNVCNVSTLWHGVLSEDTLIFGDRGSSVVTVLCYKSEGRWFDPNWCQWIFHWHKILPIAL